MTETAAQVLCLDSRLTLCACTCRAVRRETVESRRAVAQVYVCALHRIWCECGVQQQSHVLYFLCMERCGESWWQKALASQPQGRDPPQPHSPHCTLHSRCARAEKVPSTSALPLSHSVDRVGSGVSSQARASPALLNAADESSLNGNS